MAIKYKGETVEELEIEGQRLLDILKTNPTNYRELYNKYNALRARIRYRTNPELRERKEQYQINKYYTNKFNNQLAQTV